MKVNKQICMYCEESPCNCEQINKQNKINMKTEKTSWEADREIPISQRESSIILDNKGIDFTLIKSKDLNSLNTILLTLEGHLINTREVIKNYLSDPKIPLGDQFINEVQKERDLIERISLVKTIISNYL